ncbi:uncharacterized protein LOC106874016 [Octopus bimaculoides]|uniref:uncharacterized protein LOC106874016 n=1 Tax=Octopus bimaculoides TaxID=37653 RepID=UPI00071C4E7F|nr:uncharacterized protein LOC106874016 [Octopus bimaculoides]|eukprot:XP_014777061.1 PREDICTED: uncharacterized protein LOC106874016 [Octopus bimaculoides]
MIKIFHRQLKAALSASADSSRWIEFLPIVLSGLRSSIKEDIGYSPAELLYRFSLTLPGQMIVLANTQEIDTTNFVECLRDYMSKLPHMNIRKQDIKTYLPKDYSSWTHAFVRNDAVKHPLAAPYSGAFRVLSCTDEVFTLDLNGRKDTISVDRLKGAHIENTIFNPTTDNTHTALQMGPLHTSQTLTTKSGRRVHWPKNLTNIYYI